VRTRRNPLTPIGVVLLLLGIGNWYTGIDKIAEYERALAMPAAPPAVEAAEDYPDLTPRSRATLLRALGPQASDDAAVRAKLDFYRVVHTGGRVLTLLGLCLAAAGLIRSWLRPRPLDNRRLATRL
jgi:hypothetical protein